MLTDVDVRSLLGTDASVERMFLNDEFDVWAVGDDLVAKFPRTAIDADKIVSEVSLHPTLRRLLGDIVPAIRMTEATGDAAARFIVHERATGSQGHRVTRSRESPSLPAMVWPATSVRCSGRCIG